MSEMAIKRGRDKSGPNGGTLASAVVDQLRQDIVMGLLAPELWLRIDALKERYNAGSSPIREALNRLCSEGLVVQHDQRGFQVAPVSLEDLADLTRTRGFIYEIGLRESIALGDMTWEEMVLISYHRLSRTDQLKDETGKALNLEWFRQHRDFHRSLISACQSRWLLEFSDILWDLSDRYRFLAYRDRPQDRADIREEHQALMEATLARDTDLAIDLIKRHIRHTADLASHFGHAPSS